MDNSDLFPGDGGEYIGKEVIRGQIARDVLEFMDSGKKIQVIKTGVTTPYKKKDLNKDIAKSNTTKRNAGRK